MNYFNDAKNLVDFCKPTLAKVNNEYSNSLHERVVKPTLLIEIKNFMENLRSALDFAAHGLYEKYGDPAINGGNIYFPYAWSSMDKTEFNSKNIIAKKIPGLSINRPDIASKIESYQHFSSPSNSWLPKFMELNNENKHQKLTPQIRKETKQLTISSGGASMSLGQGASIRIGHGASIQIGGVTIPGGQFIDTNNPAQIYGNGKQEIITWVAFLFETNNEAVLPLLQESLNGIGNIVAELSAM